MKIKIGNLIVAITIIIINLICFSLFKEKEPKVELEKEEVTSNRLISMMLEQEDGSYKEVSDGIWPQSGYIFNEDKSKCEQGSKINYIEKTNQIQVQASKSDKCYIYFDKKVCKENETVQACLVRIDKAQNASSPTLHLHNSSLSGGAQDDSYRYSGGNNVVHNYVCFGSECSDNPKDPGYKNLYRIIGLFKNKDNQYEMKIIKADGATKEELGEGTYPDSAYYGRDSTPSTQYYKGKLEKFGYYSWNSTSGTTTDNNVNMWKESNLNTQNLNKTYYNALEEPYKGMIVEHEWQVGGTYAGDAKTTYGYEIGDNKLTKTSKNCYNQGNTTETRECNQTNDLTYKDQVGLMYMSDYMYGTLPEYWKTTAANYQNEDVKTNNWLYLGITEWTISRTSSEGESARSAFNTGYAGHHKVYLGCGVRPVIYLSSNMKITVGSGTEKNPFKLEV